MLVLTNMYPPHHYGGYELLCQEAVAAFRDAGHDVLVLTSDIDLGEVSLVAEDRSRIRRDLRLYWEDHVVLRPSFRRCLEMERSNQRALESAIDSFRPDVVSVWHMGCMSLGLLSTCVRHGLPMVGVICDDWLTYASKVDRWAALWNRVGPLGRIGEVVFGVPCVLPELAERITFCFISEMTRSTARDHGWTTPDATVTWSGINVEDFPVDDTEKNAAPWAWRLLHVGRIDDRKGIDVVLRALSLLPEVATLEILGRGDDDHLEHLRAMAVDLDVADRVSFEFVERDALADRYRQADVVVFPPRWAEPFGLVPIEAMACSTPVVATGTGGSAEFLFDEENCLLFPVDDHQALASALHRLADDPALRKRLVEGGRATAGELTLPRWADELERWHSAVARGAPRPEHRPPIGDTLMDRMGERR